MQEKKLPPLLANSWISDWFSPSVYASFLLLLTNLFYWDGVDLLSIFIFPQIATAVVSVFACVFIGALVKACRTKTEKLPRRFRFVALDLMVALVATFFPFTEFRNRCDFNLNLGRRMEVVEMAGDGKLSPSHDYQAVCALPVGWEYLSKGGGEVIVTEIAPHTFHVLFFTYRGILARYSGFEYSSDGKPPCDAIDAKEVELLHKNWYWIAH